MKRKKEKIESSEALHAELTGISTVILSTFQGITVEQDSALRRAVQAAGGKYQVVKNSLAEHAAPGTPAEELLRKLAGTNSIAYTTADPVALAKALTKAVKEVPVFKFRAGVVEGRVISVEEIQQLAQLPGKEELISKVMFLLQSPARRLATVMAAVPRNLAVVVDQAAKENKFGGSESAPDSQ